MLAKTKNKQGLTLTVWEAVPVTVHGARLAPGGNRFAFLFFSQNPGRRPRTRLSEPPDAARQPQEKRIQPNSQPPGSPQPETVARGSGLCWQGTLPRSLCWDGGHCSLSPGTAVGPTGETKSQKAQRVRVMKR